MRVKTQFIVVKGCYFIQHRGTEAPAVTDATDGTVLFPASLEDPGTSGATIITGLFDGPVDITVETDSDVTEPADGHWEVVNEARVTASAADLVISVLFSDPEPSIPPDHSHSWAALPSPCLGPRLPRRYGGLRDLGRRPRRGTPPPDHRPRDIVTGRADDDAP